MSGLVRLPVAFASWLEHDDLVDEFDHHWHRCRIEQVHGDALTSFADVFEAPAEVFEAINHFG